MDRSNSSRQLKKSGSNNGSANATERLAATIGNRGTFTDIGHAGEKIRVLVRVRPPKVRHDCPLLFPWRHALLSQSTLRVFVSKPEGSVEHIHEHVSSTPPFHPPPRYSPTSTEMASSLTGRVASSSCTGQMPRCRQRNSSSTRCACFCLQYARQLPP
jgi:hypothetical protein